MDELEASAHRQRRGPGRQRAHTDTVVCVCVCVLTCYITCDNARHPSAADLQLVLWSFDVHIYRIYAQTFIFLCKTLIISIQSFHLKLIFFFFV